MKGGKTIHISTQAKNIVSRINRVLLPMLKRDAMESDEERLKALKEEILKSMEQNNIDREEREIICNYLYELLYLLAKDRLAQHQFNFLPIVRYVAKQLQAQLGGDPDLVVAIDTLVQSLFITQTFQSLLSEEDPYAELSKLKNSK